MVRCAVPLRSHGQSGLRLGSADMDMDGSRLFTREDWGMGWMRGECGLPASARAFMTLCTGAKVLLALAHLWPVCLPGRGPRTQNGPYGLLESNRQYLIHARAGE